MASDALNHPGLAASLSNEDLEKLVIPEKNRAPPMLNSGLVERLADLVVERVLAKLSPPPSQGGDHGFESRMRYQKN